MFTPKATKLTLSKSPSFAPNVNSAAMKKEYFRTAFARKFGRRIEAAADNYLIQKLTDRQMRTELSDTEENERIHSQITKQSSLKKFDLVQYLRPKKRPQRNSMLEGESLAQRQLQDAIANLENKLSATERYAKAQDGAEDNGGGGNEDACKQHKSQSVVQSLAQGHREIEKQYQEQLNSRGTQYVLRRQPVVKNVLDEKKQQFSSGQMSPKLKQIINRFNSEDRTQSLQKISSTLDLFKNQPPFAPLRTPGSKPIHAHYYFLEVKHQFSSKIDPVLAQKRVTRQASAKKLGVEEAASVETPRNQYFPQAGSCQEAKVAPSPHKKEPARALRRLGADQIALQGCSIPQSQSTASNAHLRQNKYKQLLLHAQRDSSKKNPQLRRSRHVKTEREEQVFSPWSQEASLMMNDFYPHYDNQQTQ